MAFLSSLLDICSAAEVLATGEFNAGSPLEAPPAMVAPTDGTVGGMKG